MSRQEHLGKCFVFGGCPVADRHRPRNLSVVTALSVLPQWFLDHPPFGETGDFGTDLKLADAFRMLIHLEEPGEQLGWIERQLKRGSNGPGWTQPYETILIRWWLDIFEDMSELAAEPLFDDPLCAYSGRREGA
jgi:hypothetical protein